MCNSVHSYGDIRSIRLKQSFIIHNCGASIIDALFSLHNKKPRRESARFFVGIDLRWCQSFAVPATGTPKNLTA